MPVIKNARSLGTTPLRRDALAILEAGLAAVDTGAAVRRTISRSGDLLRIGPWRYDLRRVKRLLVVAIGKAALDASCALERILGDRLNDGVALDVRRGALRRMTSRKGTHPFPTVPNMKATGEILGLVKDATADDLVLCVVSGGGSALLCWPTELTCTDLAMMTRVLMRRGATIEEINTIRKHVSDVQGGQLAVHAAPARTVGLIFSDVPGDDPATVASGPTFLDRTTVGEAARLLKKYDLLRACKLPTCNLRETPKDPRVFRRVRNLLVVSARQALRAMTDEARRRGYRPRVLDAAATGEAAAFGRRLARAVRPGEALLAAGETTVTIRGRGTGGRNQELSLAALARVPDDALVVSLATDGIDNTPAAGGIADAVTRAAAARRRLDPAAFLKANDSYAFFGKTGNRLVTGPTGRNVSDLMLALRARRSR